MLPIALVFLLILAVLVGSLVHERRLQTRLAIDLQARVRTFQTAENTLSAGERWLEQQATAPSCSAAPCPDPRLQPAGDTDWSRAVQAAAAGASTARSDLVIEDLGVDPLPPGPASAPVTTAVHLYRLHARATDPTGIMVELESVYALGRPLSANAASGRPARHWSRRPGRLSWRQRTRS